MAWRPVYRNLASASRFKQCADNVAPFILKRVIGYRALRAPIPIAGIRRVTLLAVQIGMHPCRIRRVLRLDDFMRPVPIAARFLP